MNDVAAYYDRLAAEHGHSPRAVDAPSQEALDVRYRALGDVLDLNGKRVLDVGCGYGGLGAYLTERYPQIDYEGIDISAGLMAIGREIHPELRLTWKNLLTQDEPYDVMLAQGIFYKVKAGRVPQMIARMWARSREAIAFTAITTWADTRDDAELRVDPTQMLAFCHSLTPYVAFRHDYHPGDGLFAMFRNPQ